VRVVPVGVAVVNWNGRDDTLACVESLWAADPRPARVAVVDNASTDDSVPAISAWIARHADSGFEMLRSNENRGFAGASNLALQHLASDAGLTHFFLLNNDAAVDAGCLAEIERALAEAPSTGIVGPTVFESGSARVWYAGGVVSKWRAFGRSYHEFPRGGARVAPTEFVSGCAMVISRRAWDLLGPLPECYFMYFEDAEYCVRARGAGLEIGYAPRAVVHHRVAGTVDRGAVAAGLGEYRFAKSRALFARRNLRGPIRWTALTYLVVAGFAKSVLRTIRGRPARAWAAFRGMLAGLLAIEGKREAPRPAAGQAAGERPIINQ